MGYSHVDIQWKDIDSKLMNYIDRYFDIRFGDVPDEEKAPLRSNEKGALQGYLQSFDDKNGKWMERLRSIKDKLMAEYVTRGYEVPKELADFEHSADTDIASRIKIPLKAMYRLSYYDLLQNDTPIASYDENGNLSEINANVDDMKKAINLFALTGAIANRVGHATANLEEAGEAYEDKHQMIAFLLTAVYDHNRNDNEKIECKFAKLPSKSDGHAYPAFTLKLPKPDELGKVSLHFGGSLGTVGMLFDLIPSRLKEDPDYMLILNEGSVGDIKSPNIPRSAMFT